MDRICSTHDTKLLKNLFEKCERKTPVEGLRHSWKVMIQNGSYKMGGCGAHSFVSRQNPVRGDCEHDAKGELLFDQVSEC
jgi:hypothetical protein